MSLNKRIICGNALLCGEHGFTAIPGMDRSKLTKGISEAIVRIRSAQKLNGKINIILIKNFYTERNFGNNTFTDIGYYEYFAGPNMVVPIRDEWVSFNDYLADMNPKYRRKVNSTIKKGEDMTRKSLTFEEIGDNKDELYRLYLQVADKAKFKLFVLNPDMLQELKRSLKDRFVLDAYYVENRIVAYTTRIFNGETMEGYSHGLEYELNKQYDIYQNILIDDIKAGIKTE